MFSSHCPCSNNSTASRSVSGPGPRPPRADEDGCKAFFRLAETEPESARSTAWVLKGEGHGGRLVSVHKYDDIAALYKKRVGAKAEKLHYPCTFD